MGNSLSRACIVRILTKSNQRSGINSSLTFNFKTRKVTPLTASGRTHLILQPQLSSRFYLNFLIEASEFSACFTVINRSSFHLERNCIRGVRTSLGVENPATAYILITHLKKKSSGPRAEFTGLLPETPPPTPFGALHRIARHIYL